MSLSWLPGLGGAGLVGRRLLLGLADGEGLYPWGGGDCSKGGELENKDVEWLQSQDKKWSMKDTVNYAL